MNTSKVSLFESSTPVVMGLSQGLTETQPVGESHSVAAAERKWQDLKASCLHPSPTEPCLWLDSQAALKAAQCKDAATAGVETPRNGKRINNKAWLHCELAFSALGTNIGNTPGN